MWMLPTARARRTVQSIRSPPIISLKDYIMGADCRRGERWREAWKCGLLDRFHHRFNLLAPRGSGDIERTQHRPPARGEVRHGLDHGLMHYRVLHADARLLIGHAGLL